METIITMQCGECKRRNYNTVKNKKNDPDRLELKKYCRWCRKHTPHRETIDELRKVVWPTPQELYRYTLVVVVTVSVIALFIFAVDTALSQLSTRFIYGSVGKTG